MADEISLEDFNAQNLQAPVPGSDNDTPVDTPVAQEPEVSTPETTQNPKDVIEGVLRQQDYTRKTQQIAEERRALEAEKARLADLASRYDGLAEIAEDPELLARVQQSLSEQPAPVSRPAPRGIAQAPVENTEVRALRDQLAEIQRSQMNQNLYAATGAVQGRHHLTQSDMSTVLALAVQRGWFRPGMMQGEVEQALEDAAIIAFRGRATTDAQRKLIDQVKTAEKAVTTGGAAASVPRQEYSTAGKTIAQVRADAMAAGRRGL